MGMEGLSKLEVEKFLDIPVRMNIPFINNLPNSKKPNTQLPNNFGTDTSSLVFKQIATELSQAAIKSKTVDPEYI
jgi:hypothetical protein